MNFVEQSTQLTETSAFIHTITNATLAP